MNNHQILGFFLVRIMYMILLYLKGILLTSNFCYSYLTLWRTSFSSTDFGSFLVGKKLETIPVGDIVG